MLILLITLGCWAAQQTGLILLIFLNDYNNLIFVQDEAIAKAYTLEFEEMWSWCFSVHNKLDNTPHKFIV